eukprot:scaffold380437_cov24-Prasinocladus_malaysianus.AAC.1
MVPEEILRVAHCLALDAFGGFGQPPASVLCGGHNLRVDGNAPFLSLKLAHSTSPPRIPWYVRARMAASAMVV